MTVLSIATIKEEEKLNGESVGRLMMHLARNAKLHLPKSIKTFDISENLLYTRRVSFAVFSANRSELRQRTSASKLSVASFCNNWNGGLAGAQFYVLDAI